MVQNKNTRIRCQGCGSSENLEFIIIPTAVSQTERRLVCEHCKEQLLDNSSSKTKTEAHLSKKQLRELWK
jgi:DNA-directed RNA polymerase subunit RPC12/RpoP